MSHNFNLHEFVFFNSQHTKIIVMNIYFFNLQIHHIQIDKNFSRLLLLTNHHPSVYSLLIIKSREDAAFLLN